MRQSRPIRLAVVCPKCFQAPAVRVFAPVLELLRGLPAEEPVQTVKCQWCRTVYEVTAKAYHDAA